MDGSSTQARAFAVLDPIPLEWIALAIHERVNRVYKQGAKPRLACTARLILVWCAVVGDPLWWCSPVQE